MTTNELKTCSCDQKPEFKRSASSFDVSELPDEDLREWFSAGGGTSSEAILVEVLPKCDYCIGRARLTSARAALGELVKTARGDRTIAEVADQLNFADHMVEMIESGNWMPSTMSILHIACSLDIDLNVVARAAFGDMDL